MKNTENVLDPNMLTEAIKEQTKDTLENLINSAVKNYLTESVKDEDLEDDADKAVPANPETDEEPTIETVPAEGGDDAPAEEPAEEPAAEPVDGADEEPAAADAEAPADGNDEWSSFDDYKVGDGEYDMTGVKDINQLAKVWKLMDGEDDLVVKQQDGKVELKDNETGAEYLIDLAGDEPEAGEPEGEEPIFEITFNKKPIMKEDKLGYTDNYQDKDVMTGKEPYNASTPNETNDWDEGAPKDGKSKPWAGPSKKEGKPYAGEVNEEGEMEGDLYEIAFDECGPEMPMDAPMEEGATFPDENSMRLNPGNEVHNEPHRRRHNDMDGNMSDGSLNESIKKKLAKIQEENNVLKSSLVKYRKALNEAFVTNYNISNFVKLVLENSTTKQEKIDILKRFSNEAKTVEQSNVLFESINKQLKSVKNTGMAIDKPIQINESAAKINENTIYKNDDEAINYALDMIQRMNNLG